MACGGLPFLSHSAVPNWIRRGGMQHRNKRKEPPTILAQFGGGCEFQIPKVFVIVEGLLLVECSVILCHRLQYTVS